MKHISLTKAGGSLIPTRTQSPCTLAVIVLTNSATINREKRKDKVEVIKVNKNDLSIITYILTNLIDASDKKGELPTSSYLKVFLDDDRTYLFAAIIDGIVVGYVLAYRFPSLYASEFLAYLYDIEVLPIHRRKGVGRLLVESLKAQLKSDGVKELWLGTAVDNIEGQSFFSSTGAIKSDETFNDYTYYLT
ncbi:MAG: GNAT family N-acetyltransferase [Chitinophagaceae bacterium]|nr:GNAT family N-acetyltransferase [Chitinophagaceae bacterium]